MGLVVPCSVQSPKMPAAPKPRSRFRAPAGIFWTAFLLRLAVILIGHTYRIRPDDHHFDFGFEAGRIAQSLVTGHGYGNPFNGRSGPTAWLGPLYPLLMAYSFRLFGIYTNAAAIALLACNSLFSALVAPAVYEIAGRSFDAYGFARRSSNLVSPVATWSAWLWAVYPAFLQYAVHWVWEMSLSTCLFTWAIVIALRLRCVGEVSDQPRRSYLLWLLFGLLWAEVALSNPSLLLLFPVTIVWVVWPHVRYEVLREPLPFLLKGTLLALISFGVAVAPWVIRNQRVLHAPILTRDNFGIELWQSTHFYWYGFPWGGAMPLNPNDPEFRHFVAVGEVKYAAEKEADAVHRLAAHPELFVRNTLLRFQFFWAGLPHAEDRHPFNEWLRMLNYSVLSVTGLFGLLVALQRRVIGGRLYAAAFLFVPLVYYAVTVQPRFRHPLEPLIAILTVYLFRSAEPRTQIRTRARNLSSAPQAAA